MFGDTVLILGLAIWAKELTGSNSVAGTVLLALVLPGLVGPAFGVLIDRFPRRSVLLVNDGASAVLVLLLLFVHSREQLWIIYLVAFLYGIALLVGTSARSALIPSVVDDPLLPTANASLTTAREALRLVGPLTGAALLAVFGGHALALVDSATFLVSVACLLAIHPREAAADPTDAGFVHEAAVGLRHIRRTPVLWRLLGVGVLFCSVVGISESTFFAVVDQGLGRPPTFLGVLSSAQGVGAIAGGLCSAAAIRRLGEMRAVATGGLLCGLGALLATSSSLPVVLAACMVFGAALPLLVVASITLIQRRTPAALQGRVLTGFTLSETIPQTASIALGAALIAVVDYRLLLAVMAAGLALSGLWALAPVRGERASPVELGASPVELGLKTDE